MSKLMGVLALVSGITSFGATVAAKDNPNSVAVLDIAGSGVAPELLPTLTEILTAEIAELGRYKVVAGRDIQAMMGFEKQKDVLGCSDASCLAEIGGALGVERIVASQIGRVGSTYVVNIKLINIRTAATEGRVYETVKGEDDVLIDTVRRSVLKLFGASAARGAPASEPVAAAPAPASGATQSAQPEAPVAKVHDEGPSLFPLGPVLLGGAGAVGFGFGALLGASAKSKESEANSREPHSQVAAQQAQRNATAANVMFVAGGAAVAGGLLWFFLSGDEAPSQTALAPLIGPNSVGLAVSGGF